MEKVESKITQQNHAATETWLRVALDNMPGALVYTDDDLNIVFCNHRFKEMYQALDGLLQPGCPYPDFLRFLAENGYYGKGDVEALVVDLTKRDKMQAIAILEAVLSQLKT